ncbi:leucyl aminopeptidase [Candidatus Nitronereus thalassa]|uniref:Probable cytosol aminopeptidase n=1 Tax=Candidatus Nitronereus thalassa TaxID=3020898 RepID=A0ABU3K8A8_9BACT|nr:leucyl aminopeptidase [Candidatus Nitronereus thalassa]MDT7042592.1 leucyl aminopeptidase [Candidatus Nitronereus thalassa]
MNCQVKQGDINKEATEVLVLGGFEDEKTLPKDYQSLDKALGGQLQELRKSGEFTGKNQQAVLIHTRKALPAKRILFMGLGKKKEVTLDRVRQAMGTACKQVKKTGAQTFSAPLLGTEALHVSPSDLAQAMVEGAILGGYQFNQYRSDNGNGAKEVRSITLLAHTANQLSAMKTGAKRGEASAQATSLARDLSNHPANVMTPTRVAQEAKKITKEGKVKLTVLERKDQEKLGMGGMIGVSQGSQEPPKFIILEYSGGKKNDAPIVLVGKTVTFDSGGISLKPSENMEQMKADMTGGAEVLGAVRAAARLKLPINLVGILPTVENMPGGRATKPGDILNMLNGKTVEVQNTDAEGRLILADGLSYATRLKPKCVVDVATLTGACVVALGQFAIGMLGNDDRLKAELKKAGEQAGERVWEMPLWDEYFEQLKSDVADMRNIGGRGGGMITAGMFLSKFVGDYPWVHLDIASTDWSVSERPYVCKGPTAIGTRLLVQFLINRAGHS